MKKQDLGSRETFLTPNGVHFIEEKIRKLQARQTRLAKWLSDAPALSPAHEKYYLITLQLGRLNSLLRKACIVDSQETQKLGIGREVKIQDLETGKEEAYLISTPIESAPELGIISYASPLAKAVLGHELGGIIEFEIPAVVSGRFKFYEESFLLSSPV